VIIIIIIIIIYSNNRELVFIIKTASFYTKKAHDFQFTINAASRGLFRTMINQYEVSRTIFCSK